jgi:hypothetical protein
MRGQEAKRNDCINEVRQMREGDDKEKSTLFILTSGELVDPRARVNAHNVKPSQAP